MPLWFQHLLALLLTATAALVVLRQALATLRGRPGGKLGSCCAKGCDAAKPGPGQNQSAPRVVFLPADMLTRRRR